MVEEFLSERHDVVGLYAEVFDPCLVYTGQEWQSGRLSVAHEHFISSVTAELIHRYGPTVWAEAGEGAPVAIACCVPGERHSLGLMMVADLLRSAGLIVHMLGEGLPSEAIADCAQGDGANHPSEHAD